MSQAISSLWAVPITADAPVACDRTEERRPCLSPRRMDGRVEDGKDGGRDVRCVTKHRSILLLVHDGLFWSSVVLGHSLTHSFIYPVSCVKGFLDLCVRFTHSVRPLFTGNSHSYAISLQYLSMRPFVFPLSSLSVSLCLRANTHTHPHTHTLWLTSACSASVSVSISTLPTLRPSLSLYLSAAVPLQAGLRFQ